MKILLMLLALAGVCYGRIGETYEQCVKRYGSGKKTGDLAQFVKGGMKVIVVFDNAEFGGRAIGISFRGSDKRITSLSAAKIAGVMAMMTKANSVR